jgi:SulP family sulfate permease
LPKERKPPPRTAAERKMTTSTTRKKPGRNLPILGGILPIDRSGVLLDIIAGITLAALAIPEVMGYTKIAGMPVVTGLYTILIPMALYALFGSSRHLVVGADSATAAIMAAGLAGLATAASPEYVAYAGILALLAAALLTLARIVRLGFIADFLSRTVLIGFLTGVGIQVAIGQVSGMLGIRGGGVGPVQQLISDFKQLGQTSPCTVAVSIAVVAIIVGCRRINRRIPGALIAVVGTIVVSYLTNLSSYGVAMLGTVAAGLPRIGLPAGANLNASVLGQLLPIAFSMFIVILAQSSATSRAYATRYSESFSENTDLVGLGLANVGAGLSGTFVVNGSPTKTQMVDSAGGRSQLATLTTSAITLIVLLFLTKPLAYMPEAALSSIVFLIGVNLIDAKGMGEILAQRPAEFWVASLTALTVILVGVEQGIILAIVLSIFSHTRHGYKPKNEVLTVDSSGKPHMLPVSSHAQVVPGLVVYRFNHSMYYANAERFSQEVLELVDSAQPPLSWFCVDLTAVDDIDFSAAATLRETCQLLKQRGVRLVLAEVEEGIRHELDRSEVTDLIGKDAYFETVSDVPAAYIAAIPNNRV